jgi:outer membrane protein assembly complex protein YaeT
MIVRLVTVAVVVALLSTDLGAQPTPPPAQPPTTAPPSEPQPAPPESPAEPPTIPETAEPPATVTPEAPPERWQTWDVTGELLDPPDVVRAFLEQRMENAARVLTQQAIDDLGEFCEELHYELVEVRNDKDADGKSKTWLVLRPVVTVFWIYVNIDNFTSFRAAPQQFFEQIFPESIQRRMQVRQGDTLPRNAVERGRMLTAERTRIEDYLRNEGFFDVRVKLSTSPFGKYAVKVHVDVNKGRRYTVGKVTVVGNPSISSTEIAAKFHHRAVCLLKVCVGTARFRKDDLAKDIQAVIAMYRERGYPGARVRTNFDPKHSFKRRTHTVEFTVTVSERRKIDVVFEGNDKRGFPDERLERVLTFAEEGSYDDLEIENSAESIRALYQEQGRFEAQVTWERERFGAVFERIIFTIDEGPRLPVSSVRFEGNHPAPKGKGLSSGYLAGKVQTRVFRRVALLGGGGGYVTALQLRQDEERIARAYRDRGFNEVEVEAEVTRNQRAGSNAAALAAAVAAGLPAGGLYVTFKIKEGKQRTVEDVRFEFERAGDGGKDDAYYAKRARQLAGQIQLKKDAPYTDDRANDDAKKVGRHYYSLGRPYAHIETVAKAGSAPERIVVVHKVKEGPEVKFGKVMVRGNFRTDDWVVMDELGFDENDPLTLESAERAQQNLRSAGLFRTAAVNLVDFDDKRYSNINVLIEVQERERLLWEGAFGYSTETEGFLEGAFHHRNLLGDGIRSETRLRWGTKLSSAETKLLLPRWIGRRMTFGAVALNTEIAAFFRREESPRFGDLDTAGTSMTFGKSWGRFGEYALGVRWDVRRLSRDENLVRPAGASDDIDKAPVATTTGAIGPVFTINKRTDAAGRPSPLAPQGGYYAQVSASYADSFLSAPIELFGFSRGRDRFLKLGAAGQYYFKPSKRTTVTTAVRYDHGIPLGDEFLLPEVERYFAGGDTTVRGFEQDRLETEVIEEDVPPIDGITQIRVLPAGGNIRAIANLDFQIEVWDLWGIPMASALFLDTGIITNSWLGFEPEDIKHGMGAGIALARLVAPFGSISVEYAVPLFPELGADPRGRLHFNIGVLF